MDVEEKMRATWNRRLGLGLVLGIGWAAISAAAGEFYELRVARIDSAEKAAVLDACMAEEGMQALSESGIRAGVFRKQDGSSHDRYILLVHPSAYSIGQELIGPDAADGAMEATRAYLEADPKNPVFSRQEVSLIKAVPTFPRLKDPDGSATEDRYFELRVYESATEVKGALKIDMFEAGGEIELFGKTGLDLVFFGQAVAGANLPQLSYMLVYENEDAKNAAWKNFIGSPEWDRLKNLPRYKDTVSKIHSTFLVPMPYSGIQ